MTGFSQLRGLCTPAARGMADDMLCAALAKLAQGSSIVSMLMQSRALLLTAGQILGKHHLDEAGPAVSGSHVPTWSKMAVGMARVQQALGTSTIPAMRPSHGQQLSSKMICGHAAVSYALCPVCSM